MVAIRNRDAERFLGQLPTHIFLYLVFGTDAGLVAERSRLILSRAIADPKDPFQLLRISGDDLAADPLRLADEANTIPLFGGKRAIHIDAQGKAFVPALETVLAAPPDDCTIVVSAGALKKEAALRKLCEREKAAAAIECYPDEGADVGRLIAAEAHAAGLSITSEAKAHLVALLGEDRLVTRSEIEKLILYARGVGEIGLEHVEAIVSEASSRTLDAALDAAFSGDFSGLELEVQRVAGEYGDVRPLLFVAMNHALELHRSRAAMLSRDGSAGSAEEGLRRGPAGPVNFRRRDMVEKHLRAFSAAKLEDVVAILAEAAAAARLQPKLAFPLVMRALWKVASAARQGARS
jgi:DNA polymerase-3 subunit delta